MCKPCAEWEETADQQCPECFEWIGPNEWITRLGGTVNYDYATITECPYCGAER